LSSNEPSSVRGHVAARLCTFWVIEHILGIVHTLYGAPSHVKKVRSSSLTFHDTFSQALETADELLAAARDDSGDAADLSDDSILCNDDGMELLRWYVYPSECAQWVAKGVEIVPFTYTDTLFGAIRPLGFFNQSKALNEASTRTKDEQGMIPKRDPATWGKAVDLIHAPSGSTAKMGKSYSVKKMMNRASINNIISKIASSKVK